MKRFNVKMIAFDFDKVFVRDKSSWNRIKKNLGVPNIWPALQAGYMSVKEEKTLGVTLLRDGDLRRVDFVRLARSARLEPHVTEVVTKLFEMGKKQYVITLSPAIYAKLVMNEIHPRAFSGDNGGVHGETVLFDDKDRFVDTFSYPNDDHQLWSESSKLDKVAVIGLVQKKYGLKWDDILFVSDGFDTGASYAYRTVGYNHTDGSLKTVAEIIDLRQLLNIVA